MSHGEALGPEDDVGIKDKLSEPVSSQMVKRIHRKMTLYCN